MYTGRFISPDSVVSGVGGDLRGYNLYAYCFNNPIALTDASGQWPKWLKDAMRWIDNNILSPVSAFIEDIKNYNPNNQSEEVVFSSNYFSNYKGVLVIKTNFDASFSFGIIGLSRSNLDDDTLKHEYGHFLQLKKMGLFKYTTDVAIPSLTINLLERRGQLKYDYYGAPWEAEADFLGGVNRTYNNTPWPNGAYKSYYSLIRMFLE